MNTFYSASSVEQSLLMVLMFLLMIWIIAIGFFVYDSPFCKWMKYLNFVILLIMGLPLVHFTQVFMDISEKKPFRELLPIPVPRIMLLIAMIVIVLCIESVILWRKGKCTLNRNSIRQAMDTLPAAVCYFDSSGETILCNHQMHRLFHVITGKDLQRYSDLRKALSFCEKNPLVHLLSAERQTYQFPDGSVWQYRETEITDQQGVVYTEAIFSDLTILYRKNIELQKQTVRLKEMARNLKQLSDNVLILTREQEILKAKTRLHDEMGTALTAVRQSLQDEKSGAPDENMMRLFRKAVDAVRNDNGYTEEREEYGRFLEDAATIGVEVNLSGELPEEEEIQHVFVMVMRECMTNAVRHADATEIWMKSGCDDGLHYLWITNNGTTPENPVVPRGGLNNVKRCIEDLGGEIEIRSEPFFALMVRIPMKREAYQ